MNRMNLLFASAFLAASCAPQAGLSDLSEANGDGTVVRTSSGELQGKADKGVVSFLGIPYAEPPVGALRWRAPSPIDASATIRTATTFGPNCLQPESSIGNAAGSSEDCLYLNIWAPEDYSDSSKAYPVLFWIHGGAYIIGSGDLTGPREIVEEGVVVVSINYRLGRLGNFAHPLLSGEQPSGQLGSYSLLDQIEALHWVRDNIANFGGDPKLVTIAGCSAGGTYTNLLMASPKARGLFAGAWAMSDPFNTPWPRLARAGVVGPSAEELGAQVIAGLGITAHTADDLRAIPAHSLIPPAEDAAALRIQPIVDGVSLPSQPLVSFRDGQIAKVPYVITASSWEGSLALHFNATDMFLGMLGPAKEAVIAAYPSEIREDKQRLGQQVMGDLGWIAPREEAVSAASAAGLPARAAHFDYVQEARRGKVPGSMHCADERWLFGDFDDPVLAGPVSEADRAFAAVYRQYFVNFVKTGDPNGHGLEPWPEYSNGDAMLIFSNDAISVRKDNSDPQLQLLREISSTVAMTQSPVK